MNIPTKKRCHPALPFAVGAFLLMFSCAFDPMVTYGPEGRVSDDRIRVIGVGSAGRIDNRSQRRTMASEAALINAKEKLARVVTAIIAPESSGVREAVVKTVPGARIVAMEWSGDDTCYIIYDLETKELAKIKKR
ncbi:MAG: hypothetical protein AABZ39_10245 [Spirochaetota bacterium]